MPDKKSEGSGFQVKYQKCSEEGCNMQHWLKEPVSVDEKWYCPKCQIAKLKEALDVAEYALQFIISKGCLCSLQITDDDVLAPVHKGTCHVLSAQNALDEIRANAALRSEKKAADPSD